jgi:hypothetical protein
MERILRSFAAFGFIVMLVLMIGSIVFVSSPTGLPMGVAVAIMIGMQVACWAGMAAAIVYVIESRDARNSVR